MTEPTWERRELLILDAAVTAESTGADIASAISAVALDDGERLRGVAALVRGGYLEGTDVTAYGDGRTPIYLVNAVTERARRATGQWPSRDAFEDLVQVLEQREATTTDPERQSKIRAALKAVREVGHDVFTDVLAKVIEHQAGI